MNYKYLKNFMKDTYKRVHEIGIKKRCDNDIKSITIENGIVLPSRYAKNRIFGLGGVIDNNNNIVENSFIYTYSASISEKKLIDFGGYYDINGKEVIIDHSNVVYLGFITNNWGHFLGEFVSRLHACMHDNNNMRYIYVVRENEHYKPLEQIVEFLSFLKIYNNIEFVNVATKFDKIIIPDPAYIPNYYYSDKFIKIYDTVVSEAINDSNGTKYNKIYFTRKDYAPAHKKEYGEDLLNNIFKNNGFVTISPETLTLKEQINIIQNAEIICATSGTISHSMLFGKSSQLYVILNKTHLVNLYQRDINIMIGANILYVDCYYSLYPHSFGFGPFMLGITSEFIEFCKDNDISIRNQYNYDNAINDVNNYLATIKPVNSIPSNKDSCYYFNPELSIEFIHKFLPFINKNIYFRYHFSMIGWIDNIRNSEFIITKYQLEAIQIVCGIKGLKIEYTILQNDVWQTTTTENDKPAGIIGKTLPIMGIRFKCISANDIYGIIFRIMLKDGKSSFYTERDICCIAEPDIICGLQIILYNRHFV